MTEPTAAELNESAMNHFSRGNGIEAARQLQWALIADPDYAEAWHNRAMILRALNDPFDAILCVNRAISITPHVAAYHNTKGVCWASMNQMDHAKRSYDEALSYDPELAEAWHNKAYAARLSGRIEDAVVYYEKAVNLRPENHDYHMSYASALLASGRLTEGWHEYEHRSKVGDAFNRNMPLPEWIGGMSHRPQGVGLVLYAEQGHGDAIQFLRYAPLIKQKYGVKVYVEVKKPLVQLARTMHGIDGVIQYGESMPPDATHCLSLMSAPILMYTDVVEDIPTNVPYFSVPAHFPETMIGDGPTRIGLCWRTGVRPHQPELAEYAQNKSIAPHFLRPLGDIKGVAWVSLQVPVTPDKPPFEILDISDRLYDFYETARTIMSLDLVVTVDTSVAHLAGALGKSTLLMTPRDNCWRWFGDRIDSPWYPSLYQFRQSSPGDWPDVIKRVALFIKAFVS